VLPAKSTRVFGPGRAYISTYLRTCQHTYVYTEGRAYIGWQFKRYTQSYTNKHAHTLLSASRTFHMICAVFCVCSGERWGVGWIGKVMRWVAWDAAAVLHIIISRSLTLIG